MVNGTSDFHVRTGIKSKKRVTIAINQTASVRTGLIKRAPFQQRNFLNDPREVVDRHKPGLFLDFNPGNVPPTINAR